MARATVHGNWRSILALTSFVTLVGITMYAVVAHESLGIWLYVASFATLVFGFWSKEDHIAIGGIVGLFTIVILDIILRVGLLGFTECKPDFSAWTGCP